MDEFEHLPPARKFPRWLVGCAIAAGAVLVLIATLAAGGFYYIRSTTKGFNTAIEARKQLEDRFGPSAAFVPSPDGAVPAARMEVFLKVRDATQPARSDLVQGFGKLPMSDAEAKDLDSQPFMKKLVSVLSIGKTALGLPGRIGNFFQARNQALLETQMGMGEYTYIYVLSYFDLLGHQPGEGLGQGHVRTTIEDDQGQKVVREIPPPGHLKKRVHDEVLSMLKNQLGALPGGLDPAAVPDVRAALEHEIQEMTEDPARVAWADGLPPAVAASLEPYKERLEATYSKLTNEFELARNRKRGNLGIQAD